MPEVVGLDLRDARAVLRNAGIHDYRVHYTETYDAEHSVVAQEPRGGLLVERGRSSEVVLPQTLVELQIKAMECGGSEAVHAWRELGDRALYVSGFFRSSLSRKNVSVEYYQAMGATAYDHLAGLMRWTGVSGGFDTIYEELAHQFHHCSTVIRRVRAQVRKHSDADILKLYEEWVLNPDPVIAEQLNELGVDPFRLNEDLGC